MQASMTAGAEDSTRFLLVVDSTPVLVPLRQLLQQEEEDSRLDCMGAAHTLPWEVAKIEALHALFVPLCPPLPSLWLSAPV